MSLWIQANPTSELWASSNEMELDDVMTSVYRQVLGNAHLIESDRLSTLESQLRNRDISVRQFVAAVALSDAYRQRFFDTNSQYRFIELNFKHLLGRAPRNQAEIAEHTAIYAAGGYEAEILSYIDSDEYGLAFGENIAPYTRTDSAQLSQTKDFLRTVNQCRGYASSDLGQNQPNARSLASNLSESANPPIATRSGGNQNGRFEIVIDMPRNSSVNRRAAQVITVDYAQLTQRINVIQRQGARIRTVKPVAN
ncbi:hypothetical protein BM449_08905 [Synechococcus sp. SynAce01]|nr:hypothetical protein BM449_08905 [Synechococcus sp. SynAce01]